MHRERTAFHVLVKDLNRGGAVVSSSVVCLFKWLTAKYGNYDRNWDIVSGLTMYQFLNITFDAL